MAFPAESVFRTERAAVLATVESLTDDQLDNAPTLCEGWAPRDVCAHLMGVDYELGAYVRSFGRLDLAHAGIVERGRALDRPAFMARMRTWAASPALLPRTASWALVGDLAIHHQDILRGMGRNRAMPIAIRDAILREGAFLGARKLLRYHITPTDGGRVLGRGQQVKGTSEVLGLWLSGRKGLDDELSFA